jgi:hypothetical protein
VRPCTFVTGSNQRRPAAVARRSHSSCVTLRAMKGRYRPLRMRDRHVQIDRECVPVAEVAARAGHARASMTLDVSTHVLVDDRGLDRAAILGLS